MGLETITRRAATVLGRVAALATAFGLVACGGSGGSGSATQSGTSPPGATQGKVVVALTDADGDFLIVTASGNLSVTGPLLRDPVIAGTINVENAEIGIPDVGGGANTLTDVNHIAPPPAVARTLERAELTPAGEPLTAARSRARSTGTAATRRCRSARSTRPSPAAADSARRK